MKKSVSRDYIKLFFLREGKIVFGNKMSNLWLLTAVITLTFLSVSFSNASLDYLSYKMNDPFINWVDIKNDYGEGRISDLLYGLSDSTNQRKFHFVDYQMDYTDNSMYFGKDSSIVHYLSCRFFQSFKNNSLLNKILDSENIINGCSVNHSFLTNDAVGVIITEDAINKLGYEDEFPSFIQLCRYSQGADQYGFKLYNDFGYIPIPVIAIVKKLPMNMDIISTNFFYEQNYNDRTYPFNLNNLDYARSLIYFVPDIVVYDDFRSDFNNASGDSCFVTEKFLPNLISYKGGKFFSIEGKINELSVEDVLVIDEKIRELYPDNGIIRVYDYDFSKYELPKGAYISIQFADLNRIKDFEEFVKQNYSVSIEMSQINAKDNFNSVSIMANILSWAIVVFSMLCVILFEINLYKSYFQKVKKNLGTFKAFGISNSELVRVYVLIILGLILLSILLSLVFAFGLEKLLEVLAILKDGSYSYLSIYNVKTLYSGVIICVSSIATVYFLMRKLLSTTPGNLINDR